MQAFLDGLNVINNIIWHDYVLYIVLGTGVLFTIWSGFSQYHALTHGVQVIRGKYDDPNDPGAINHFQALSTALSATVGLGNIGGVAVALALGGPGAVFWMWMVGLFGMALKTTEVTLSMLERNTDDPDNPHGGPMWVAKNGFSRMGLAKTGGVIGGIFCITLIISAITGGNMFQAWNVAEITNSYFPTIPKFACGALLAVVVGMVIIGGIKRIGAVTGRLVPFMCILYLIAAFYVLFVNIGAVPEMLKLIVVSAFTPAEATGAFLGGTAGYAFLWGMKRALFSSEAGQGSAPIAHSAAKTDEPVREGVVAGLEPFIDTIVVCTLTTLVLLLSGAWNREAETSYDTMPAIVQATELKTQEQTRWFVLFTREAEVTRYGVVLEETETEVTFVNSRPAVGESPIQTYDRGMIVSIQPAEDRWIPDTRALPRKTDAARRISADWKENNTLFMIVHGELDENTGRDMHRMYGSVIEMDGELQVNWMAFESEVEPVLDSEGIYNDFVAAALTGHAFDRVMPGLGMWLVTIACWLFAISTMISWAYYGEQGIIYLLGERFSFIYKMIYCALIVIATMGFLRTDAELDALTALGTGVMLWANIPIMLIFGAIAMKAYHSYIGKLKRGEFHPHAAPSLPEIVEGRDHDRE